MYFWFPFKTIPKGVRFLFEKPPYGGLSFLRAARLLFVVLKGNRRENRSRFGEPPPKKQTNPYLAQECAKYVSTTSWQAIRGCQSGARFCLNLLSCTYIHTSCQSPGPNEPILVQFVQSILRQLSASHEGNRLKTESCNRPLTHADEPTVLAGHVARSFLREGWFPGRCWSTSLQ